MGLDHSGRQVDGPIELFAPLAFLIVLPAWLIRSLVPLVCAHGIMTAFYLFDAVFKIGPIGDRGESSSSGLANSWAGGTLAFDVLKPRDSI